MKRKLLYGAALLVVFAAILAVMSISPTKRVVPSDAVKILDAGLDVQPSPTSPEARNVFSWVIFSNTTPRAIMVQFISVQGADGIIWTNLNDDPSLYRSVPKFVPAHAQSRESLGFLTLSIPRPWRFRVKVCEELKGADHTFAAAQLGARSFLKGFHSRPPLSPVAIGTNYFGHRTEIIIGEDRAGAKIAGDGSTRP